MFFFILSLVFCARAVYVRIVSVVGTLVYMGVCASAPLETRGGYCPSVLLFVSVVGALVYAGVCACAPLETRGRHCPSVLLFAFLP